MADVVLKSLTKSFENVSSPVVDDVSFEVKDREFMVLVGPSGCGKSTTLRMIAGLEDPTRGEIYIGGENVTPIPPKDRDIAMVFQNYALYPHLNVYENLAFSLKLRKHDKEDIRQRVEKAAEILGIHVLLKRRPKELSGGQRQRVALGRAIVREPKVFLFDEPLSNLDAKLRVQMRTEILKLHHQLNSTMIYVTHDQMEAMTMGDRIVILKDGVVQQIDEPMKLYNHPVNKFVAGFIGSPAMNFIELEMRESGLGFGDIAFPISQLPGGTAVSRIKYLGIRPEKLKFIDNGNLDIAFDAVVEVSEKMGHETLHYLKLNQFSLVLREMGKRAGIKPGSVLEAGFNLEDCHLFDEEGLTIQKQ
jgi:multiple sugar transport system ATP-binding protein